MSIMIRVVQCCAMFSVAWSFRMQMKFGGSGIVNNFPRVIVGILATPQVLLDYVLDGFNAVHWDKSNWTPPADTAGEVQKQVREHIKYGEMVQSTYDFFRTDGSSVDSGRNILGSGRSIRNFVERAFPGYTLRRTLESVTIRPDGTRDDKLQFFGYVAYNEQKKDLAIIFRGTQTVNEWGSDASFCGEVWDYDEDRDLEEVAALWASWSTTFKNFLTCMSPPKDKLIVHRGFKRIYTEKRGNVGNIGTDMAGDNLRIRVKTNLLKVIEDYGTINTISVSGHSLGSALASICAIDLAEALEKEPELRGKVREKIQLITYACPKFAAGEKIEEAMENIDYYHYLNRGDIVPCGMPGQYRHSKTMQVRRFDPYQIKIVKPDMLKKIWRPAVDIQWFPKPKLALNPATLGGWHNLEHILYNLWTQAGLDDADNRRDPALMNKSDDLLDDKKFLGVLKQWWSPVQHKGMKLSEEGFLRQIVPVTESEAEEIVRTYVRIHSNLGRTETAEVPTLV